MLTEQQTQEFLKNVDIAAPFWKALHNEKEQHTALYNLVISRRDMKLYCSVDMKPHRHWKIGDVKKYFGLKGRKEAVRDKIITMCDEFLAK